MNYIITLAAWTILLTVILFPRTKYPKTIRTTDAEKVDKSKIPRMFTRWEAFRWAFRRKTK